MSSHKASLEQDDLTVSLDSPTRSVLDTRSLDMPTRSILDTSSLDIYRRTLRSVPRSTPRRRSPPAPPQSPWTPYTMKPRDTLEAHSNHMATMTFDSETEKTAREESRDEIREQHSSLPMILALSERVEPTGKQARALQEADLAQVGIGMGDVSRGHVRRKHDLEETLRGVRSWPVTRDSTAVRAFDESRSSSPVDGYGRPAGIDYLSPRSAYAPPPKHWGARLKTSHLTQSYLVSDSSDATALLKQGVTQTRNGSKFAEPSPTPDLHASFSHPGSLTSDSGITSTPSLDTGLDSYRAIDGYVIWRIGSHVIRRWLHQAEVDGVFRRGATYRSHTPAIAEATATSSHHRSTESKAPDSRSGAKGRRQDSNSDQHSDGDDMGRKRRPERYQQAGDEPESGRLFDCPYHKHDPQRYSERNVHEMAYRGCASGYLKNINRMKQHLYRVHQKPEYHCRRCYLVCANGLALETHSRLDPPCTVSHQVQFSERMTNDQYRQIKRKHPLKTPEENWYVVYDILWPGESSPASPYVETEIQGAVQHFLDFLRRDASEVVERELRQAGHHVSEELTLIATSQVREATIPQVIEIFARRRNLEQPPAVAATRPLLNVAPVTSETFPTGHNGAAHLVEPGTYATNIFVPALATQPMNPFPAFPYLASARLPLAHQQPPLPNPWAPDPSKPPDEEFQLYEPNEFNWNLDDLA